MMDVKRMATTPWIVAGLGLLVASCSGGSGAGDVELVEPDEFAARMEDPEAEVINVHVPYEGEIPGTDLFVPFDEIDTADVLPADHDQPLLVYCWSGNMSAEATATLADAGYTDLTDLEGGMAAWQASGRRIDQQPP
jgi:rhodanese-related sulfurtransferase